MSISLGSYQLHDRLGEGGSGQVFRADGPSGPVAIKVLAPAADLDPAARARFGREAAALTALQHPGLIALLDHGIDDELGPYLVLPLLDGPTLRARVGGAALCPEAAVALAQPIAEAVAALHAAGYVHRDIKPDNVMVAGGRLTLIDLGLAWREGMPRLTETGVAVGSVGYMSPEQLEGRAVGAATDVWAIGAMLYEWIAGQRPFARARAGEEAAATLLGRFPPLPSVDRRVDGALAELIAACLHAAPPARPSAAVLVDKLAACAAGLGLTAAERAVAFADPASLQRAVAPRRARACEDDARAALRAGQPFEALAACDRGLAYAPADPALAALIAEIERTTGASRAPIATAVALPGRRSRAPLYIGGGLAALLAIGILAGGHSADPKPDPAAVERQQGLAFAKEFIGVFGKVVDESIAQRKALAAQCRSLTDARDPGAAAACKAACKAGDTGSCS